MPQAGDGRAPRQQQRTEMEVEDLLYCVRLKLALHLLRGKPPI
jgi:hypothetical protein